MAVTLERIWPVLKGVPLAVLTMSLVTVDLAAGYLCLRENEDLFNPLNHLGLIRWGFTYAAIHPWKTLWLFLLFVLLFILAVNTLTCTTSKVLFLYRIYRNRAGLISKLFVHIMHYALLVILFGLLASYTFPGRYASSVIAVKGESTRIPGTDIYLELVSSDIDYYRGNRLKYLNGRTISVHFTIGLKSGETTVARAIGINSPFFFNGLGFYLEDFGPKSRSSMNDTPYVRLLVKRDRGTILYFSGTLLFTIGLALYLFRVFIKGSKPSRGPRNHGEGK